MRVTVKEFALYTSMLWKQVKDLHATLRKTVFNVSLNTSYVLGIKRND